MKRWKTLTMLVFGMVLAASLTAVAKSKDRKTPTPDMTQEEAQKAYDTLKKTYPALVSEMEAIYRHRVEAEKLAPTLSKKALREKRADLIHADELQQRDYVRMTAKAEAAKSAADATVAKLTGMRDDLKSKNAYTSVVESHLVIAQKKQAEATEAVALLKKLPSAIDMILDKKAAEDMLK